MIARRYKSLTGFSILAVGHRYSALRIDMPAGERIYIENVAVRQHIEILRSRIISILRKQKYRIAKQYIDKMPPNGCCAGSNCHGGSKPPPYGW